MTLPRGLLGPEGYWLAVVALSVVIGRFNVPATERGSDVLVSIIEWMSFVTVPLAFWLVFRVWPRGEASWLATLGRLWLSTLVGLNLAGILLTMHVDYHDSRNSGVGSAPVLVAAYGSLAFLVCTIVVALPQFAEWGGIAVRWDWKSILIGIASFLVWGLVLLVMIGARWPLAAWAWATAPILAFVVWRWVLR